MFRFTIRDLLWLMVGVGLASGWWIDRSRLYRDFMDEYVHHYVTKTNFQNYNKGAVMVDSATSMVYVWTGYGIGNGHREEYHGQIPIPSDETRANRYKHRSPRTPAMENELDEIRAQLTAMAAQIEQSKRAANQSQ